MVLMLHYFVHLEFRLLLSCFPENGARTSLNSGSGDEQHARGTHLGIQAR